MAETGRDDNDSGGRGEVSRLKQSRDQAWDRKEEPTDGDKMKSKESGIQLVTSGLSVGNSLTQR
ncbi:hypothetical protein N7462_004330 [Penicillium macrosclerotiorum]|uniref:uncharacterized protein n=1 Tax=Penicillium macrosclerotiorum TaxID=303699 RepID=UPI002546B626|nr:uncharacterized protein N7462_004330 [Penicillium macrosclerotiorum]KAJ5689938.1 hypothetical protein N7462_004330 [Penicillium macrosclerotiorum]